MPETTNDVTRSLTSSQPFNQKYRLWLILIAATIIVQIPIVAVPFKWFETYFHEISHGIAALLTGGNIVKIELFANGAGLCTTRGGSPLIISYMGYAGAALWGTLIYYTASTHQRVAQAISAFIAILLAITLVFWVADLLTAVIVVTLLVMTLAKFKFSKLSYLQVGLQLTGALVLLNSIKSPWYLIDGRHLGDGAALANTTGLPEIFWVFTWFIIGISGIILLVRNQH